jgi:hypothetical protein
LTHGRLSLIAAVHGRLDDRSRRRGH